MQVMALLIAAAFALGGLALLVRSHLRQPVMWAMVAVGAFAFPITQWVTRTAWDALAVTFGVPQAGTGLIIHMLTWSVLAELFKFAPVVIVGAMGATPADDWFAYGAAAGAGFGAFAAQMVITLVFAARDLPFSTPLSAAVAILLRLFPLLAHMATTAYVAWSAARGALAGALVLAVTAQTLLGLVERTSQGIVGTALGQLLFALLALFLFLSVWTIRDRAGGVPRLRTE